MNSGPAYQEVTPVLVTYCSAKILPWSLPAVQHCAQLIVIDNNSNDDTVDVAHALVPHVQVIQAERNLGFGRANNLALQAVKTPYALLINPDAQVQDGAIEALWSAAQRHPQAAILAPVIFDSPGVVGASFHDGTEKCARLPPIVPDGDLCVNFVSGAAMLLNLQQIKTIGFFDPWYFLYGEDDDLCIRIRRAGLAIMVIPQAQVEHHTRESSVPSLRTTFRRAYCMTLSKFYITRKYQGPARCLAMILRIGIGSCIALPIHLLLLRSERALRMAGRIAASAMAWRRVRAAHCFEPSN